MINTHPDKIKTVIIDDEKQVVSHLKEQLEYFPEVQVCGCATQYHLAKRLLLTEKPDLVFLEVEMPGKSGFDLIEEVRSLTTRRFSIVFYSAFDQFAIRALRKSAFDYLLKPIKEEDLENVIQRYLQKKEKSPASPDHRQAESSSFTEIISLPTNIGLSFIPKNNIIMFRCRKESSLTKVCWEAVLTDLTCIKLKQSTTAKNILQLASKDKFLQINQATIININYLGIIEFKTQECILAPPYENHRLTISRNKMTEIRELYDVL